MKRFAAVAVVLAVVLGLGLSSALAAARRGAARGTVLKTDVWRGEADRLMLSVTLRTEGDRQETFSVGPGNPKAYATVGMLKKGQRVVVGWVAEDDRKWIREIGRLEGEREGGEREGGERTRRDEPAEHAEREGGERTHAEEGEVRDHPEEGEVREHAERDRDVEAERLRRVERELAEMREKLERMERGERTRDERTEAGERRLADKRERADRERDAARRHRMKGTVVANALGEAEGDAQGPRILRVRKLEGDDVVTFSVGPDRRELYEIVGRFERGDRVIVVWISEGEHTWLHEIGRID